MPELPDLELFSQNLTRELKGKKLLSLSLSRRAKASVSPATMQKALKNSSIKNVTREGKELRFHFSNKNTLGMHLMLKGKLSWFQGKNDLKGTVAEFKFAANKNLALTDYQFQANLKLNPEESNVPDALSPKADLKFWKALLESRSTIKNLLLDQKAIRGIGNAYADEILWEARISPFSIANKIPAKKITAIRKAIKKVLQQAMKEIKKIDPRIIGGEIRSFMKIHNAKAVTSPTGKKILQKTVGGRKTYYTNEQELFS